MHLQKLRHVRLLPQVGESYGGTYDYIDWLAEARLFHRLPAIEAISVDGITSNNDADGLGEFPPCTSNIKGIHVGNSMLRSSLLAPLIRMPKSLEEFTHSVGGRDSDDGKQSSIVDMVTQRWLIDSQSGGHYIFTAKTLGKALWGSRSSLRELDVDVDSMLYDDSHDEDEYAEKCAEDEEYGETSTEEDYLHDEYFRQDEHDSPGPLELYELPDHRAYNNTIGSLHDFEALTHLSLGIKLLLGPPDSTTPFQLVEGLPKSLRSLTIRGYTKGVVAKYDAAIGELLARRSEVLPALAEVDGVEELIPSADVEVGSSAKGSEEARYWVYSEDNEGWLAA